MLKKFLLPLILIHLSVAGLLAQPDFIGSTKDLSKTKRTHPYLFFDEAEKQKMLIRIKASQTESEVFEKILWEGRKYLFAPEDKKIPEKNIHTRFSGEDEYRKYMTWNSDGAMTLAFLYQMTGDEAYAKKAYEYAENICNLDSWINRAHYFEIIYSRVWPFNVKDDQVVFSYDITASQYAKNLAIVYDWIYNGMTRYQQDRIRGALLERAITLTRGNYEYFWWATAYKCNWSAICHSSLGITALALLNEDPRLTDVVARSYEGVWNVYENLGENGGWQEGRGYWAFAMDQSVFFDEALKRMTSGNINLFKHKKVIAHPCDFALFGITAGFCDSGGEAVGASWLINKLTTETGSTDAAWYRKNFIKSKDDIFDLIWPVPDVKPKEPTEFSKYFTGIDWAVMRKNFDPENITIACKAGMNDDPHHGHLDCGTFNLTWMGQSFIGELKGAGYDEKYFGELRWEYPKASSKGHNLILVNGEEQTEAKYKDQKWKEGVGGKILDFKTSQSWDYVTMDPTKAYPGKELKHWTRRIILDKENNFTLVFDQVSCAVGAKIEARFQPGVNFTQKDKQILLQSENSAMEVIPFSNAPFDIQTGRIPNVSLKSSEPSSWYKYFSTTVSAKTGDNLIGHLFIPAGSGKVTAELRENGKKQQIICRVNSREITYEISENTISRSAR
ncbi:MAG: heparinase II/III family protein [Prolixibacteraceae bacterium]